MSESVAEQRVLTRESLGRGTFDVAVVGGGILGIATAWAAARAGLRVALLERGDFAGATSSASSKLVHGGLRYLAMGDVRLVHENHVERRALGDRLAPHLVRPLPFLVPVFDDGPHSRLKLGAGVLLYSALSGFGDGTGKVVSPARARELAPGLKMAGLRGCALYYDHQMNDSRVAVMSARAAVESGAVLLNHAEVTGLRKVNGRVTGVDLRDRLDGTEFGVDARVVVNATGPWLDHLRRMENPKAAPSVRLSKGAHLVLRTERPWTAAVTTPIDDVRVNFAIPWEGQLLLGTTDEAYEGDPAEVRCTEADVDQILAEAALGIDAEALDRDRIAYTFAGLRVLPGGPGETKNAKRETVITVGSGGMLSVAGGKWTTFRKIGGTVLARVAAQLGMPGLDKALDRPAAPLPGAAQPDSVSRVLLAAAPELPDDVAAHLATHYGTHSHEVVALAAADPALLERVHPDGPDIWAQVVHAIEHEWACDVEDVLRRRTTVSVRGLDTPEVRARVAELLVASGARAEVA
ncbi:glycerol-3-phosphate dehydrogenase [Streptoalloteichus tenebrarius]|uniref:Glycerol-3-phosphate dehydrogenase n=1 Tax=Streptoalloteichus tenebrarius (strain ATCC 17920 / DSM 40477 / JCM 4838 / CBS 697.72 / NBRC 16177 / NCIMB 11028 / NRRL B-12390 / A12253. 1 / ISP 5477) TaxID=1933 RepID=A0ABT1HSV7_STRSD|nr:glycerol-3-phosphate dehydrogenase/oxidase [Streptoalloteichus tenebrarius]MCP2258595.1 glycerol-3-phosphate dehydrogenase [Streptoalloteichus tenebrarius]BFF04033.1 glycerol-3-phosphate dehydrogenase/oxidase [Streptoalloteichus tenebrarius]